MQGLQAPSQGVWGLEAPQEEQGVWGAAAPTKNNLMDPGYDFFWTRIRILGPGSDIFGTRSGFWDQDLILLVQKI